MAIHAPPISSVVDDVATAVTIAADGSGAGPRRPPWPRRRAAGAGLAGARLQVPRAGGGRLGRVVRYAAWRPPAGEVPAWPASICRRPRSRGPTPSRCGRAALPPAAGGRRPPRQPRHPDGAGPGRHHRRRRPGRRHRDRLPGGAQGERHRAAGAIGERRRGPRHPGPRAAPRCLRADVERPRRRDGRGGGAADGAGRGGDDRGHGVAPGLRPGDRLRAGRGLRRRHRRPPGPQASSPTSTPPSWWLRPAAGAIDDLGGDVAAVEDLLVRVGMLVDAVPEIHTMRLNPVLVDGGAWA